MAVLSSWGPGGALGRRCLPHTGTLQAWAPGQRGCICTPSSQGPNSPGHRQVLRGTWRPPHPLPLCSARPITSAVGAARVLPDARGTAAGSACQEAHAGAGPKEGTRGTRACPPPSLKEEKGPRSLGCVGENRCAHTLASDSWQPQQHYHQNFPGAESHFREFSLSASVPLPGQDPVYSKQQEIGAPEVHTPASTFSTPWPGQRAQGRCPAPGLPALSQGQASWDAAQPTYHGDSRRGRASSGSGCLGTGAGTRSPGRTSKVGSLRQKNKLQTPKHSQEPMETQMGLHPGGIRDAR